MGNHMTLLIKGCAMAEFEISSSSSTSMPLLQIFDTVLLHVKMSQTSSAKVSKVATACEYVIDHIKSLPKKEKCKDEDL
jgi:hypothetical protein